MKINVITKCSECPDYKGMNYANFLHYCKLSGEIEIDPKEGISKYCVLKDAVIPEDKKEVINERRRD
jgi:hypothetical protein